ncbi:MAG: cysteine synthase family protein [Acidobacteriaceae bacterium]|nr:cysteine synthase family protein [Acidobacteriaceae bacterium]MBV9297252.1 cysteine synthase family protein [Acidobacteriaceae bacterium]MBV9764962.1 cysteine synthase family protein [Acidobacteriaceae bacterium]
MPAVALPALQSDLLSRIGNTPLLEIGAAGRGDVRVFAKAEFFNPGGSVKDRPALNMIREGEESGKLRAGKVLLDSTSGNTGIAYAMICAVKGYAVKLCLPENASPERQQILRAYGAELVLTPAGEGSDGAQRTCQRIYASDPKAYFYPDQYSNPANWQAHFQTTGPEILEQTGGRVTHFVAALGTTGTFTGVTKRLRHELPPVRCISVQPASPLHGLEGTKHMPSSMQPAIYDPNLADENLWVETEDAYQMARQLARTEGLLVGVSAAANVVAATRVAEELSKEGRSGLVVTVLCDGGQKYLSESFWND